MKVGDLVFCSLLGVLVLDVLVVAWWDVRHMLNVGAHYREDEQTIADLDETERRWREWKDAA